MHVHGVFSHDHMSHDNVSIWTKYKTKYASLAIVLTLSFFNVFISSLSIFTSSSACIEIVTMKLTRFLFRLLQARPQCYTCYTQHRASLREERKLTVYSEIERHRQFKLHLQYQQTVPYILRSNTNFLMSRKTVAALISNVDDSGISATHCKTITQVIIFRRTNIKLLFTSSVRQLSVAQYVASLPKCFHGGTKRRTTTC